ncbi:MAG TPA: hypothetical protein VGK84_06530 [Candidatus Tumulicola sp.]|jgi:hypothetical protein
MTNDAAWNGRIGTAGGTAFGTGLAACICEQGVEAASLADALGLTAGEFDEVLAGARRIGVSALARLCIGLRLRPIEFLQRTAVLSLEVYAFGVDPLYFLPEGPLRYDARIYMREINPRHRVPEGDMTRRNPTLKALAEDPILDTVGKAEVELAYLLRAAVEQTGGTL